MLLRRLVMGLAFLLATAGLSGVLHKLQDRVPVVVTTAAIAAHTPLTADKLAVKRVNREALTTLAPHAVQRLEDAVGLVARMEIPAGEVVRREPWLVAVAPDGADMAAARYHIPDAMRLAAVRVDSQGAVAGLVQPGDRVDVIFTARQGSGENLAATTLLQGVEVYAVGPRGAKTGGSSSAPAPNNTAVDITLLVTPDQAQQLALAKRSDGSLDLTIAPPNPPKHSLPPARLPGPAPAPATTPAQTNPGS